MSKNLTSPNSPLSLGKVIRWRCSGVFQNGSRKTLDLTYGSFSRRPRNYRPLPSVGPGLFELRDQDQSGWYRVVYLSRIDDVIYVLHCFEKKSREMPEDFQRSKQRLKAVKARLAQEKKREKRG